jgi:hypothetical protein
MALPFSPEEIFETIRMTAVESFDIRTVTVGVSLRDCLSTDLSSTRRRIREKILRTAGRLPAVVASVELEYGIPVINRRVSVTPVALLGGGWGEHEYLAVAETLDEAGKEVGIDFLGGWSALVQKGITPADEILMNVIPQVVAQTSLLCCSINAGTTRAGLNMDAVRIMARVVKEAAAATAERRGIGCARIVVFMNAPEDNPFMAGAFHGPGEGEARVNVGISGPGVVASALKRLGGGGDLTAVAETIKATAFKITRAGELIGREVARRLDIPFGIVDLSLAPTPRIGDSVAEIIEVMGIERCGAPGTTAALALLNDAVKKGGAFASSSVGGLSGSFIPVSEDAGMIRAVQEGALTLDKLEAMTAVCSVGLDMVAVPGDTPEGIIAGIMADELAIGMVNHKTTGVRILPIPGGFPGETIDFGGLLGSAVVMEVSRFTGEAFIGRGGRIPPPLGSLTN